MARTIGIGVIGMGWMGMTHSRAYSQVANRFPETGVQTRLVACADEVQTRADEAQKRFGFARSTTDWRSLMTDPKIEVVNITTPNNMHLEVALAPLLPLGLPLLVLLQPHHDA